MKVWKYGRLEVISLATLHKTILSTQRTILLNYYFHTSSLPHFQTCKVKRFSASLCSVGKDGFEPPNSGENRFTVCCRWPLDYLPDGNHCLPASQAFIPDASRGAREGSRTRDLLITNQLLYQLSYSGLIQFTILPHIQRTKTDVIIHLFFWEGKGKRIC
jgi:hypothetical protein